MKRSRNILIALLLCVSAFTLVACNSNASLSGRYVIVDVLYDPEGATFADLAKDYTDINKNITDYCYIEFNSGDRFELVMFGDKEAGGTYVRKGKTLTLTSGGKSSDAIINGKKITYTYDTGYETGAKLLFKKK